MSGQVIGPYRVVQDLGQGGMGTVFLAVRADDQFKKRVAIKVLRPGLQSADIVARFRNERQIVASIDHPHVAKLLDGGATEDGLPYFVMEYVEGKPLDEYCDSHRLPIAERLALFRKVCSAVHFAHQNLVVHRDLKPENILVAEGGDPKLLDFGIAKLLDPERAAMAIAPTRLDVRLMTPQYASPEQVRGERITTASDVYSLGVLLYELLTGHPAYRLENRELSEITKLICEDEPKRPSAVIDQIEEVMGREGTRRRLTPETVSRTREGSTEKLRRRLRGDLDTIVLTAMRKEPKHRYTSAQQLSDDIERYLDGRPVLARKGNWSYRARKFVRRNRLAVGISAAAVVSLISISVVTARERDLARSALARARKEEAKAKAVSEFLQEMLVAPDPFEGKKRDVTVLEILEAARPRIDGAFPDQPEVRGEMVYTLGTTYFNLDMFEEARLLAEESVSTLERVLGKGDPALVRKLIRLGTIYRAQSDYRRAEEVLRRALEISEASHGEEHADTAEALHELGSLYWYLSRFAEAENLYTRALSVKEKVLGRDHKDLGIVLNDLAILYKQRGDFGKAEPFYERAIEIEEKALGPRHPELAITVHNLGSLYVAQQRFEEAERLFQRSLAIKTEALGRDHQALTDTLTALGGLCSRRGDLVGAEGYLRRALALREKSVGPDHPETARVLSNLGSLYTKQKRYALAEATLRRALEIQQKGLPAGHHRTADTLRNLGTLALARGKRGEARAFFEEAIAMYEKALGPDNPTAREVRADLAQTTAARSRPH